LNVGLGADVLGHVERALKRLVQADAGVLVLQGEVVSLLELAQDFRFSQHHGIEAARDFEEVTQAVRFVQRVKFIRKRVAIIVDGDEEFLEFAKAAAGSSLVAA